MSSTIAILLIQAQGAVSIAQALTHGDARLTLALDVVASALSVIQGLHAQNVFDPSQAIEINDIGGAMLDSIQRQLDELAPGQ